MHYCNTVLAVWIITPLASQGRGVYCCIRLLTQTLVVRVPPRPTASSISLSQGLWEAHREVLGQLWGRPGKFLGGSRSALARLLERPFWPREAAKWPRKRPRDTLSELAVKKASRGPQECPRARQKKHIKEAYNANFEVSNLLNENVSFLSLQEQIMGKQVRRYHK